MRSAKTNLSPVTSEEMRPLTIDEIDVVAGGATQASASVTGGIPSSSTSNPAFAISFNLSGSIAEAYASSHPGSSSSSSFAASTGTSTAQSSASASS